MKIMKENVFKFLLFVYTNYIYEDWSVYNKLGKICIYPAWIVRSFFIWLISPIFLPEYWFKQSHIYKEYKRLKKNIV
jgi:hypothetical protein